MTTRYPLVLNGSTIEELQSGDSLVVTSLGFTPIDAATKGVANGVASLDSAGLVPSTQLPSYVDDVLEFANLAAFPATGETGKIYVAIDTGKTYRWSGSVYVEISASPGTTDALVEGSTNQYFTQARARQSISVTQNLTYNSSTGVITGPNLSSYLTGNQNITVTGDAIGSGATSIALTLANTAVSPGSYGSATAAPTFTVDSKGRLTAAGSTTITPAWSSITSRPTTLSGFGITDGASLNGPTFTGLTTFSGSSSTASMRMKAALETVNTQGALDTSSPQFDVLTSSVVCYTSNSQTNWTLNVRGSAGVSLNSIMANGESLSIALITPHGGTAYYQTGFQIDGSSRTVRWQGGTAPTSGNASSHDIYVFTIVKISSDSYFVYGSLTRFA